MDLAKKGGNEKARYKLTHVPDHPLAPDSGYVARARVALFDKIGPDECACTWCGMILHWAKKDPYAKDGIVADHLDFDTTNDSPDNLVPACRGCNMRRRDPKVDNAIMSGESFVTFSNGARTRTKPRSCEVCGSEFLAIPSTKKRSCSESCALMLRAEVLKKRAELVRRLIAENDL